MISCVVFWRPGKWELFMTTHTVPLVIRFLWEINHTAVVVTKDSVRSWETVAEMGRLMYRAFPCEVELDYTTVNGLLLVMWQNVCESIKNWCQLIYSNLSWPQLCVQLPCVCDFEAPYASGSWLQLSVCPHMSCNHRTLQGFSAMIQEQFVPLFQFFGQDVNYFYQKNTRKMRKCIFN